MQIAQGAALGVSAHVLRSLKGCNNYAGNAVLLLNLALSFLFSV